MTLEIPMLLALLGTALMAVAIFAPRRVAAPATVSFAPPLPNAGLAVWAQTEAIEHPEPPTFEPIAEAAVDPLPTWPALVDPRAAYCDVETRLALIDALASVPSAWARTILERASIEEPDALVRAALETSFTQEKQAT